MMKLWLQEYAKRIPLAPSVALSIVTHVVLIGAAIVATADSMVEDQPLADNSIVRFLAPPDRAAGQKPQREMVRFVAIAIPSVGTGLAVKAIEEVKPIAELSGPDLSDAPSLPELHGADSVFTVLQVDSAAARYEWSAAPAYPPAMLEKSTPGYVRAEFTVTTDGYADTLSLRIIESTHPDFTKAVRDALPFMRFRPAKIGRHSVSQLVLQEFRFEITTLAADTLRPQRPIP